MPTLVLIGLLLGSGAYTRTFTYTPANQREDGQVLALAVTIIEERRCSALGVILNTYVAPWNGTMTPVVVPVLTTNRLSCWTLYTRDLSDVLSLGVSTPPVLDSRGACTGCHVGN